MADNFTKHLGMGYHVEEQEHYNATILNVLNLTKAQIEKIKEDLGEETRDEIKELVNKCVQN